MITLTLICAIIVYIGCCYISSIEIYSAVKYAFLTKNNYDENISGKMSEEIFDDLNRYNKYNNSRSPVKIELRLDMILALNDIFNKGVVWMCYSITAKDMHEHILQGSWRVPITLHLKRNGWNWMIVKKDEAP